METSKRCYAVVGGYRDLNYLLLKAKRLAFTKTQFITFQKAA